MLNPSVPDPAPIFAALGDRTRLALLGKLADGQARSIAALSTDTALTRQAITKHLHVLQDAGLVASLRVGRESRFAARRRRSTRRGPISTACHGSGTRRWGG